MTWEQHNGHWHDRPWAPAPIITQSLIERLRSRDEDSFADKLLAGMRNQFGGHPVKKT